jgi:hypothetical protein
MTHLPAHDDLTQSALNYLTQAKNSLCRQYEQTHSDVWAMDRPLIDATRLVNQAISILTAECRPARPQGEATALAFPRVVAACPAPPPENHRGGAGHNVHPGCAGAPETVGKRGSATRPAGVNPFDVGTAWIGPFHSTART